MATLTRPARTPRTIRPAHGTARLTLHLNGTAYAVRLLTTDPASGCTRLVRLRKADGVEYHVSRHAGGPECSCPDWIFSREGLSYGPCKHIAGLMAVGLL
jgi:hypothetical protein